MHQEMLYFHCLSYTIIPFIPRSISAAYLQTKPSSTMLAVTSIHNVKIFPCLPHRLFRPIRHQLHLLQPLVGPVLDVSICKKTVEILCPTSLRPLSSSTYSTSFKALCTKAQPFFLYSLTILSEQALQHL